MDTVDSGLPGGNASSHWYDTWDRQTSQSFTNTAKGLRNAPGENNCFLNSAVQVFWHIDVFRRSYRRLSGHLCMGHSCIFCALKVIFTQFQYSDQSSLQPSALRKALANTFAKQERFQLGHMDDAAECFENILNRIHYHIANGYNEDACNAPHCIPHQKFAMTVFDQLVCPCGAQSEPHKFYEMVHYISANALVSQSRTMQESGDMLHPSRFGLLLRNAGAVGDVRDCPGNCGKRVQIRRTLLNVPDVVSVGLVWGSDKADPELAAEVTRTIGTTILYPDMFHSVMCSDGAQLPRLNLTSVVCYYGKHYSTFIYHTKLQAWVYFDDATVRQVGPDWRHVVERIVKSRYQPLLLIYTNPNAQSVPTETAPSTRVMAPGYSMTPGKGTQDETKQPALPAKSQSGAKRLSAGGDNRSEKEPLERSSSFEHRRQSSFMLAVTKQKTKEEAIYAVPHNNTKVMNSQKDLGQSELRGMYTRQASGQLNDIMDGPEDPDSYNYTLSNSDQYRRPGMNNLDHSKLPLTQNFVRGGETQRKESFKKGKGKVAADVIRYHVDATRRPSQSSDSSDPNSPMDQHGPLVSNNKPALPMKPKNIGMRSQSFEENMSALADGGHRNSHKVIKPQATNAPMYDNVDSVTRAHTPVQSGLATLPRNKKSGNSTSSGNMNQTKASSSTLAHPQHRSGSHLYEHHQYPPYPQDSGPPPPYTPPNYTPNYQSCLTYQNVVENDMHFRQSSNSSILSQETVIDCSEENGEASHNRQQSTASQDTLTDKPKEPKGKAKRKDKDEKKRDESKQKKDEKRVKTKKEKGSKGSSLDKPPPVPDKKGPDEGFSEDRGYIDRRMVESVLSFQKLQRSGSCVSQASNSSIESDSYNRGHMVTPKDNLSSEIPFDSASLDSHKDSGYGSSDRNSSSSTGSITMNPYEQYFLSRNMIPPKTINHQAMAENMRKLMDEGPGMNGLEYTKEKDLKALVTSPNEFYHQNYTVGHVSQVNPSSGPSKGIVGQPGPIPKDLMNLPKAERDQHLFDALSGRGKGFPVPPQTGEPLGPNKGPVQGPVRPTEKGMPPAPITNTQSDYPVRPTESQPIPEGIPVGSEQFIGLCHKAEDFMDSCVLAETSEQYSSALSSCQQAIDHLKHAMRLPNLDQTSYTYAQRKSNACIIKLRSLQKRLMARQESNTSSNSSDNGVNPDYRARQHKQRSHLHGNGARPPSRSGSQNSMDSLGSARSATPVFDKVMRPSTDERVPPVDPHVPSAAENHGSPYKDRSFETNIPDSNSANNADLYGTLPRRKTQKSQDHTRQCNNQKLEADVYQDFLENQRRQSDTVNHSRTNSGARTPVNEPNSDLMNGQNVRHEHYHQQPGYHSVPNGHQSRMNVDSMTGFTYSRMSQGLKPIPVAPPKIEKQSQHTEVGNQSFSRLGTISTEEPVWFLSSSEYGRNEHGNHSNQTDVKSQHGEYITHQSPVAKPSPQLFYNTLASHVRAGNSRPLTAKPPLQQISSATANIQTAYSKRLACNTASQCEPVPVQPPPQGARFPCGGPNRYRSSSTRQKLTRSASFSHPDQPSANSQFISQTDSNKIEPNLSLGSNMYNRNSQPDLRKLTADAESVPRPLTPNVLCSEGSESEDKSQISVRDLKSRFENSTLSDTKTDQNVESRSRPTGFQKLRNSSSESGKVPLQRQRSKSESESRAQESQKPKSVLSKKGKNGDRLNKPRKSVTFSTNICLVEASDDFGFIRNGDKVTQAGYQSDGEGHVPDLSRQISGCRSDDTDSSTSNSPVEVVGEGACILCHKQGVEQGQNYCSKCTYYMSKFAPSR